MEVGGEQQLILGTSENISGGGVALQFDGSIELNVGSRGSLSIALDGTTITLDTVRVLRVLTPSKTGTRAVLEFPDISYALRVSLVEFLMKKLGASRSCAD